MKNLRISAHEEISVPEDWKITTPLNQAAPCIEADHAIWKPAVVWLRFQPDEDLLGEGAEPGSGYWIQDEHQAAPCIEADHAIWKPAVVWLRFQPDEDLLGEGAEPGSGYWIQDEQGPSGVREVKSGHSVEWA